MGSTKEEDQESNKKVNDRRPLFSVHSNDEGRMYLYLEEQEAVLDLMEEIGREAGIGYVDRLTDAGRAINLKTEFGARNYDRVRSELRETVMLLASMSEVEALDLAQDIVRIIAKRRSPRLEILK